MKHPAASYWVSDTDGFELLGMLSGLALFLNVLLDRDPIVLLTTAAKQ